MEQAIAARASRLDLGPAARATKRTIALLAPNDSRSFLQKITFLQKIIGDNYLFSQDLWATIVFFVFAAPFFIAFLGLVFLPKESQGIQIVLAMLIGVCASLCLFKGIIGLTNPTVRTNFSLRNERELGHVGFKRPAFS